jgi:hypothetical protein
VSLSLPEIPPSVSLSFTDKLQSYKEVDFPSPFHGTTRLRDSLKFYVS